MNCRGTNEHLNYLPEITHVRVFVHKRMMIWLVVQVPTLLSELRGRRRGRAQRRRQLKWWRVSKASSSLGRTNLLTALSWSSFVLQILHIFGLSWTRTISQRAYLFSISRNHEYHEQGFDGAEHFNSSRRVGYVFCNRSRDRTEYLTLLDRHT